MAFPTSGLTNNLVHKEGNRAFVYDSTLGVWDQVQETDRLSAAAGGGVLGTVAGGTLGVGVTFPAGHVVQFKYNSQTQIEVSTTSTSWQYHTGLDIPITRTAGTKLFIQVTGGTNDGNVATRSFPMDIARSDGLTWSGTNLTVFGDSSNGITSPQYGTSESRHSISYGCVDTTSTSSAYTYRPTYRSNDGGRATFQQVNGGTAFIIVMEFVD